MPNWCTNSVTFTGGDIDGLKILLEQGVKYNEESGNGWLPDFLKENGVLYLFDINLSSGRGSLYMNCDTRWTPTTDELIAIANKFKCDFVSCYEESGSCIYGEYTYEYENGGVDCYLTDDEMDAVMYDERTDTYSYNGETSDSSYYFYDMILDKKKKQS